MWVKRVRCPRLCSADFNLLYRRIYSAKPSKAAVTSPLSHACRFKSAIQQIKICATPKRPGLHSDFFATLASGPTFNHARRGRRRYATLVFGVIFAIIHKWPGYLPRPNTKSKLIIKGTMRLLKTLGVLLTCGISAGLFTGCAWSIGD